MTTHAIPITHELLHALPKTDLHCHLDGSLRSQTMLELADREGLAPRRHRRRARRVHPHRPAVRSLEEYLKAFDITLSVLQTEESLFRAAYEFACDASARTPPTSRCGMRRCCTRSGA